MRHALMSIKPSSHCCANYKKRRGAKYKKEPV